MKDAKHVTQWHKNNDTKGFLADIEGETLYTYAERSAAVGPCLEIGSYCGKSTIYLAAGCQLSGNIVYAVDHHLGSEEHQFGEEYHDSDLYDSINKRMDSFPTFRRNIESANLIDCVIPIISSSKKASRHWRTPLGMVFIDGGHSPEMAMDDCLSWSEKIASGGYMAVHDIFEKPEEGGQGPYLALQAVLENRDFVFEEKVGSMVVLRRV